MWPMKLVPFIFQVGDAFVVEKFWIRSSLTIVRTTMSRLSGGRVKSLPLNLVIRVSPHIALVSPGIPFSCLIFRDCVFMTQV